MKTTTLTALCLAVLFWFTLPVLGQPAYTLDDRTLTVSGAELVSITGPGVTLNSGGYSIPAWSNPIAIAIDGGPTVWTLATGEHTVTAAAIGTSGDETVWVVVIDPPAGLSRIDLVRSAYFALRDAVADFTALSITQAELFRAVILGPVPVAAPQ